MSLTKTVLHWITDGLMAVFFVLVGLLFAVSAMQSVRAVTDARNAALIAVLGRAGFQRAVERQAQFKRETCTEIVFLRMRVDA